MLGFILRMTGIYGIKRGVLDAQIVLEASKRHKHCWNFETGRRLLILQFFGGLVA